MYCRNCANPMDERAAVCVKCGVKAGEGDKYCPNCGAETDPNAAVCTNCGVALSKPVPEGEQKSKLIAGLLAIFLGGLGIHNFYLGDTTKGVLHIVLSVLCGLGAVWGLIDGILILCGKVTTDAKGVPLKD